MGCIDNSLKLIHYIGGSQWGDGVMAFTANG